MGEGQVNPAMRRAAPGRDLLVDRIGRQVARRRIAARLVAAVIGEKLAPGAVEQPSAELVAERVPHDRVHADQARREMPDRKELHELHVDEVGPGGKRQRIAVAAHIRRGAVAPENPGKPAGGDDHRLGGDRHCGCRSRCRAPPRRSAAPSAVTMSVTVRLLTRRIAATCPIRRRSVAATAGPVLRKST